MKKVVRVGEVFGRCSADFCLLRRERYNSFYEHLLCTGAEGNKGWIVKNVFSFFLFLLTRATAFIFLTNVSTTRDFSILTRAIHIIHFILR